MLPDIAAFIEANLPLLPVPGIAEVRLHQAAPDSGLHRLSDDLAAPYWAYRWAGGLALARHVLDRPELVRGRRVLDLGSGSGLVAIAAALVGARHVIAAEVDAHAATAIALNAAANGVVLDIRRGDLTGGAPPPVDFVLAGDLFYAPGLAASVTAFLERCTGIDILIGDPWRASLPLDRLVEVARYQVRETGREVASGVFAWR
jgi:predicted nicotinamide N-methyase